MFHKRKRHAGFLRNFSFIFLGKLLHKLFIFISLFIQSSMIQIWIFFHIFFVYLGPDGEEGEGLPQVDEGDYGRG